eukprot:COSAG04_NODE_25400_length_308_cov_0.736842_1_plen_70_part_01
MIYQGHFQAVGRLPRLWGGVWGCLWASWGRYRPSPSFGAQWQGVGPSASGTRSGSEEGGRSRRRQTVLRF